MNDFETSSLAISTKQVVGTQDYEKCLTRLGAKFRANPLKFGFIGFSPFVVRKNGTAEGPMIDLIYKLGRKIGLDKEQLIPVPISWNDLENNLEKHEIDIVVDPIIEGRKVAIVGYARIHTPFLVYPEEVASMVDEYLDEISSVLSQENGSSKHQRFLHYLSRLEKVKGGFGVTYGTIEHKIADIVLKVRIEQTFMDPDISKNISDGIKSGLLMIADEPSFRKVEKTLRPRAKARSILPNSIKSTWIPTGFAIPREDEDLQNFLAYESKFSDSSIIRNTLTGMRVNNEIQKLGVMINDDLDFLPISQTSYIIEAMALEVAFTHQFVSDTDIVTKQLSTTSVAEIYSDKSKYKQLRNMFFAPLLIICLLAFVLGITLFNTTLAGILLAVPGGVLSFEIIYVWYITKKRAGND